jgi:hypothetical protein
MLNKLERVCRHMKQVNSTGFTIQTATMTMDARGPKNHFYSIHFYENGKLVKTSETGRVMVEAEILNRFDANDPTLQINLYTS